MTINIAIGRTIGIKKSKKQNKGSEAAEAVINILNASPKKI